MLSSSRNATSVCLQCVYRIRLRLLQQKRLRSSTSTKARRRRVPTYTNIDIDEHDDDDDDAEYVRKPRNLFRTYHYETEDDPISSSPSADSLVRYPISGDKEKRTRGTPGFVQDMIDRNRSDGRGSRRDRNPMRDRDLDFRSAVMEVLKEAKVELQHAPVLEQIAKERSEWDGDSGRELGFRNLWRSFTSTILRGGSEPSPFQQKPPSNDRAAHAKWKNLAEVFKTRGKNGLSDRIKYYFYEHVTGSRFTESDIRNQRALADLRYPAEWYPATRSIRRQIHLHVGPTNSGKTYHALQKLEQATTGAYGGPLRLLAHEIFARLNAKGKHCALLTGEEMRVPPGLERDDPSIYDMSSCTVEMMAMNSTMEVAVLDEIQMIGDPDRGWAWTQALLGVKAEEVHLCGEERTVPLIKEICASVGDELTIHHYKRLSPLAVADESLDGDLSKLRKGDCIVSFSVMGIHALRRQIEKATKRKVATVYGSLPPETRAQQARLFNDPDNDYDYLVASDAVGMGLNLAIKRIIFETSSKFNGFARQTLAVADVKQIGGRAGRYRIAGVASDEKLAAAKGESRPEEQAAVESGESLDDKDAQAPKSTDPQSENLGLVTTLERFDFPIIREAMESEPEPITTAGIFPPAALIERFGSYFPPGTPFSYILTRLQELSQLHSRYHLCGLRDQVWIADLIEPVQNLTIVDRHILSSCPSSKTDQDLWKDLMPAFARCVANQSGGNLADIQELPLELIDGEIQSGREYLRNLERLHKGIVAYLWLSYRFAGIFSTRAMAFEAKRLVEVKIEETLGKFSFSETQRRKLAKLREKELLKNLMRGQEEAEEAEEEEGEEESASEAGDAAPEAAAEGTEDENLDKMAAMAEEPVQRSETSNSTEFDGLGSELEGRDGLTAYQRPSQHGGGGRFSGEEDVQFEEPDLLETAAESETETPAEDVVNVVEEFNQDQNEIRTPASNAEGATDSTTSTTPEVLSEQDIIPAATTDATPGPLSSIEEHQEEETKKP